MKAILDLQGFKMPVNKFVLKELAAIKIYPNAEGYEEFGCLLVKPPCEWDSLPAKYKCQNKWCERNHHGIPWNAGDIPYDDLKNVLDIILKNVNFVYVKGLEKKQWITDIIGDSKLIINMEDLGCPALRQLPAPIYQHYKYHNGVREYNCAFENVQRLKEWYLKHGVENSSLPRSLRIFAALGSLRAMKTEDIACLPQEFILTYAWKDIDDVWDRLPEEWRIDEDFMNYRRCRKHYQKTDPDEFDGPIPLIINCLECQFFYRNLYDE